MSGVITKDEAIEIAKKFCVEILTKEEKVIAMYFIGSLGGGYYRPGQSDIDTVIIVHDDATISQKEVDDVAERYQQKYQIPKGFGSVMIREREFFPPYTKSETDEFEFTCEIARLKVQGKAFYKSYNLDRIPMPSKQDFIKDALIMERWFNKEFGEKMFDKLYVTGCVNTILGILRRYLIIEKSIFEFNKFLTIDTYLLNNPPITNPQAFDYVTKKLRDEIQETSIEAEMNLKMLRSCGEEFRRFFNNYFKIKPANKSQALK